MNPCRLLDAFYDGTLPDPEHRAFKAHLADCAACQRGLHDLTQLSVAADLLRRGQIDRAHDAGSRP